MADTFNTNSTEAPTSDATREHLEEQNVGLTTDQLDFVTLVHQYFGIEGKLMNCSIAVKDYFFEEKEFNDLFGDPLVQKALTERGVINRRNAPVLKHGNGKPRKLKEETLEQQQAEHRRWKDTSLDPMQLLVANSMLDLIDTRSQKKKLQDLGVSTGQYAAWMNDPVFSDYMRERAENMLGQGQHEAHLALLDKVRMGDMKAISYYNEMIGRFVTQNTGLGTNTSGSDFKNILVRILEIINDEIDDPAISLRIADKFKGLINAQTVAGHLMGGEEPIEKPHIADTRDLTPRLQELMTKGEGYE